MVTSQLMLTRGSPLSRSTTGGTPVGQTTVGTTSQDHLVLLVLGGLVRC